MGKETHSRFEYTEFSEAAEDVDFKVTDAARRLELEIEALEPGREKSLALTKLEETIMWARKALRSL